MVCQLQIAPVSVETRGFAAPGYYVIAPLQQDTLVFVDDYGRPLFHTRVGLHTNVQTWRDKYVTHFSGTQRSRFFVRRDARLQPIDTFRVQGAGIADFHEGKIWTDTSFMLLGFETVRMDLSKVVPGGQSDATVLVGVIQEQTLDGRVVFEWRSTDHIEITAATSDIDLTQNFVDYIHINSISREPDGDLLISCRHTDEVIKVDRNTGAIVWRLGGSGSKRNQFRFLNDTTSGFVGFSHQHTAFRTSRGTLMLFDNGNLKPEPRRSRVVEYAIDEGARTVRAVWQFSADSVGFIEAMGNVEELPGGNIVIGYGNESSSILAHEVDRERGIVCTIRNPAAVAVNPYRVVKTTIGMSAILDTVTAAGIFRLADQDSTTGVTLDLTAARGRHVVAAERHHIAPPAMMFSGAAPQHVYPLRLVIRFRDPDSVGRLAGLTRISADVLPRGVKPSDVTLYRRDTVGRGVFRAVAAEFDSSSQSFVINDVFSGELIAARRALREPSPLSPLEFDTVASAAVVLTAQVEPGADSCVFRIWSGSADADTISVRVRVSADGMACCVLDQLESDRTYRWHASALGSVSEGASSPAIPFVTDMQGLARCVADPTMPTMDVAVGKVPVRWLGGDATRRCLLQVMSPGLKDHVGVRFDNVTVDTISRNLGTASIIADRPGQTYYMRVASLSDGASSAWSDTIGVCTARLPEQALVPLSPVIGQQGVGTSGRVTFTTSDVYDEYEVIISTGLADPAPRHFAVDTPGVAYYADLEPNRQHFWRVVARGSYTDFGAVGMFITGMTSGVDVSDKRDTIVSASYIRLIDGWLVAETSKPIVGVSLVDIRGCLSPIPFEWSGTTARAKMPDAARGWNAVVFYRSDGTTVRTVLAPQ
jgi:hypothetical protein